MMFVDPEFQLLDKKIVSTALSTTGARDHVTEVERQIYVVKKQMRVHHTNLTFPRFTRQMTIELANHVVILINAPPPPNIRMPNTYSPRTIIMGKSPDWKKSCKIHSGSYAQVHEDRNFTNTL